MFGYVTTNQDELKIREFRRYRSFYCGLCDSLRRRCGFRGQLILPYDMAFLDILLNALYEEPLEEKKVFCVTHPLTRQTALENPITSYCADMGLLLAYYKLRDDVEDERSVRSRAGEGLLRRNADKCAARWPDKAAVISGETRLLEEYEKKGEYDLDVSAGFTGKMLGELFVYRNDMWADILRRMGFYLGKFVYLMDAAEDLEKDRKAGRYNPWAGYEQRPDFDALVENTLTMMMAECAKEFEKLPIVQDVDILRNVIYSGVWVKYREMRKKREGIEKES